MNSRQAKKILCCPSDGRRNKDSSPYAWAQWNEAHRVYVRALHRGDPRGRVKWASKRPTTHRGRWHTGYTGAHVYGPKAQRVTK